MLRCFYVRLAWIIFEPRAKYHICFIRRKFRPEEESHLQFHPARLFCLSRVGDSCIDAIYLPLSLSLFLSLLSSGICMKISITTERSCIADESLIPRGWHGVRFRHGKIKKKRWNFQQSVVAHSAVISRYFAIIRSLASQSFIRHRTKIQIYVHVEV